MAILLKAKNRSIPVCGTGILPACERGHRNRERAQPFQGWKNCAQPLCSVACVLQGDTLPACGTVNERGLILFALTMALSLSAQSLDSQTCDSADFLPVDDGELGSLMSKDQSKTWDAQS
jgi:hypothetical protein